MQACLKSQHETLNGQQKTGAYLHRSTVRTSHSTERYFMRVPSSHNSLLWMESPSLRWNTEIK